jgi:MFS family permease
MVGFSEYKYAVAALYAVALFMDLLDTTIVNVALPVFGAAFHAGATTIEWAIAGYLLSLAVFIPVSGWAGDRFGTKRLFLFALAVFTAGSLAGGLRSHGALLGDPHTHASPLIAFHSAFAAAALLALFVDDRLAAGTMGRDRKGAAEDPAQPAGAGSGVN